MDENKNGTERNSILLEGMYNGVAGKIDEVRLSVQRELQYNSAQQVDAYEALAGELRTSVDSLLAELRYVAQQSSAIFDYNRRERDTMRDLLLEEVKGQAQQVFDKFTEYLDGRLAALASGEGSVDYDLLAERVAEKLAAGRPAAAEEKKEGAEAKEEAPAEAVAEEAPAEGAEETAEGKEERAPDDGFDYDLLAEKIATAIPETDYDLIADKVAAALPQVDENALAERIAAALPQTDENALADRVAESIPLTDYDLVAEHVVAAVARESEFKLADESIEKIARRVAELLRGDDADLERIAREVLGGEKKEAPEAEIAAAAAPVPAVLPVPAEAPAPPEGMTTRYKRSFIAKIIESEEDVKQYYSELKNALLAYQKANSQISWSNDRFTLKGETVAKIGIRGRTLCLYLALNPEEFPESVYHQKYAGDTKMYEKTPMMVKIKSGVALKRAIRLIELLMEKNGAVGEETARVDYAAQYAYRTEQELLAEGLIKTALVEKSDLDF